MDKNINKTFQVVGFNGPRTVCIKERYFLGAGYKYPSYHCEVVSGSKHYPNGTRENFLERDIVKNGNLITSIRVLSA